MSSKIFCKSWGAEYIAADVVRFRLWATGQQKVMLRLAGKELPAPKKLTSMVRHMWLIQAATRGATPGGKVAVGSRPASQLRLRFDLGTILGREPEGFDQRGGFFDAVTQDPVLAKLKLIGEPWDIGPGGYQVGGFPPGWGEWNDKYRDTVREYWKGDNVTNDFAARLLGSGDLYDLRGRRSWSSVNFITAHDGFTLNDLVSYNDKHNEANGEDNNDGHNDNRSCNYGAEGPTDDEGINAIRERQKRNFLTTLLFSHGTPMLLAGDEFGRSQMGNNNGYCQDSEIHATVAAPGELA